MIKKRNDLVDLRDLKEYIKNDLKDYTKLKELTYIRKKFSYSFKIYKRNRKVIHCFHSSSFRFEY